MKEQTLNKREKSKHLQTVIKQFRQEFGNALVLVWHPNESFVRAYNRIQTYVYIYIIYKKNTQRTKPIEWLSELCMFLWSLRPNKPNSKDRQHISFTYRGVQITVNIFLSYSDIHIFFTSYTRKLRDFAKLSNLSITK